VAAPLTFKKSDDAFGTPTGNVIARKRTKVLVVDVRAYTPPLHIKRASVANAIAAEIMGCWPDG
jgi:hypothetical protein